MTNNVDRKVNSTLSTTRHERRSDRQTAMCLMPKIAMSGRGDGTNTAFSISVSACPAVVVRDASHQRPSSTFSRHVAISLVRSRSTGTFARRRSLEIVKTIRWRTRLPFDNIPARLCWHSGIPKLDTRNFTFHLTEPR